MADRPALYKSVFLIQMKDMSQIHTSGRTGRCGAQRCKKIRATAMWTSDRSANEILPENTYRIFQVCVIPDAESCALVDLQPFTCP